MWLLAQTLPNSDRRVLAVLRETASRDTIRLWAVRAPFETKDEFKARGYRADDADYPGRGVGPVAAPCESGRKPVPDSPIHHTTARDGSVPAREGVLLGACGALLDPSFMAAGTIPLSQHLRKLAAYPRQHDLALALYEIGRIERTVFIQLVAPYLIVPAC